MSKYELAVVLNVKLEDEERAAAIETIKGYINRYEGTVVNVDEWGKKKLAYPINYETDGYYVLINFSSEEKFPAELDRIINITDGVLRSLIVAKGE